MKLNYRRIYTYCVISLFLIIAPILVFYAAGYRLDLKKRTIVRTGVLAIDTEPKDVQIFINGKRWDKKTPVVIKNLIAQDYQIELKKIGYYSWIKTLTVYPNKATLTDEVILLKEEIPRASVEKEVGYFQVSPSGLYLAYLENDGDFLVVQRLTDRQEIIKQKILLEVKTPFLFSQNENYLIYQEGLASLRDRSGQNFLLLSLLEKKEPVSLNELSKLNFSKIKNSLVWEEIFYALDKGKLYQIDIASKNTILLIADDIIDFVEFADSTIYYLCQKEGKFLLKKVNLKDNATPQELTNLTISPETTIEKSLKGLLIFDQKTNRLSLIELIGGDSLQITKLNPAVSGFQWSPDKKKLLLYNDFELWNFNLEDQGQNLLMRSSETIKSASWHPSGKWVLFQHGNKIKAIELDGRDKRNVIELAINISNQLAINKNSTYFIGQKEHPYWLYQLDLD